MPNITIISREPARKAIAALLETVDDFAAVYPYETKDFGGQSPVAFVHSISTDMRIANAWAQYHSYLITLLWRRDDAESVEDSIDELANDVRAALIGASGTQTDWTRLFIDGDGQADDSPGLDYPIIDGVQYRREVISVTAQVDCRSN